MVQCTIRVYGKGTYPTEDSTCLKIYIKLKIFQSGPCFLLARRELTTTWTLP